MSDGFSSDGGDGFDGDGFDGHDDDQGGGYFTEEDRQYIGERVDASLDRTMDRMFPDTDDAEYRRLAVAEHRQQEEHAAALEERDRGYEAIEHRHPDMRDEGVARQVVHAAAEAAQQAGMGHLIDTPDFCEIIEAVYMSRDPGHWASGVIQDRWIEEMQSRPYNPFA